MYKISSLPVYLAGGRTPLHQAALGDHLEVFQWLVDEAGADPLALDNDENSAISLALLNSAESIISFWEERSGRAIKRRSKEELHVITMRDQRLLRRRMALDKTRKILGESPETYEKQWERRRLVREQAEASSAAACPASTPAPVAPADPLLQTTFDEVSLAPSYSAAVREGSLPRVLFEESPGVFSFDMFTPEYCKRLIAGLEEAERSRPMAAARQPNSMNRYGSILDDIGFRRMLEELVNGWLKPLCKVVFPEAGEVEDFYAFTVKYKLGEDLSLDIHRDSSDVNSPVSTTHPDPLSDMSPSS